MGVKKAATRTTCSLYLIGTGGMESLPYIAKNSIGNVPTAYPPSRSWA